MRVKFWKSFCVSIIFLSREVWRWTSEASEALSKLLIRPLITLRLRYFRYFLQESFEALRALEKSPCRRGIRARHRTDRTNTVLSSPTSNESDRTNHLRWTGNNTSSSHGTVKSPQSSRAWWRRPSWRLKFRSDARVNNDCIICWSNLTAHKAHSQPPFKPSNFEPHTFVLSTSAGPRLEAQN